MRNHMTYARKLEGFTLIEVMVSITILAIGILILGGLLARSSRAAEGVSSISYQTSIMAASVGRFDALPFTQLAAGTTCTTETAAPFPHTLCTTVSTISAKVKQVKIVVTPANAQTPPDSVMFERSISGNADDPLN
jgi:prepilin-type N-terminal cleavage/methylation domain-containing protein